MEQKLISKECVPDNEVWVSPKTWEAPFGLKVNESQNKADNSDYIKCQCKVPALPVGFTRLEPASVLCTRCDGHII